MELLFATLYMYEIVTNVKIYVIIILLK